MSIRALVFFLIFTFGSAFAQENTNVHTIFGKRTFSNHFFGVNHSPLDFDNYRGGFEINYSKKLSKALRIAVPFRASVIRLPEETKNRNNFSLDGVLQLHHYKNNVVSPYLLAGAGAVVEPGNSTDIQVPLGAGINFKLNRVLFLNIQSEYRISLSGERNNYVHGVGLGLNLSELVNALPIIEINDRDGDGIADESDECPDMAGVIAFGGCPDSDGDGIGDQVDSCPDLAGLPEYKGCPDTDGDGFFDLIDDCPDVAGIKLFKGCPDSDEDGIQDSLDKCPYEKGVEENQGCPVRDQDGDGFPDAEDECPQEKGTLNGCPDSDNDGVKNSEDNCPNNAGPVNAKGCPDSDNDGLDDSKDKCPNKAGALSNFGCPLISAEDKATLEFAVQEVNFQTNSAELTASSFPVLSKLVDILNRYPEYKLQIAGHTDSNGDETRNLQLSQQRAESCQRYLLSKGLSPARISAIGLGETQPKADNSTAQGRLINRRVEFELNLR